MKSKYLYLNNEDKTTLFKLAQANQICVSKCVIIIAQYYLLLAQHPNFKNKYIEKGCNMIHLHFRETKQVNIDSYKDNEFTNAIYIYLHYKQLNEKYNFNINLKNVNSKIMNEIKKSYDPNFLKNQTIRANYIYWNSKRKEITTNE